VDPRLPPLRSFEEKMTQAIKKAFSSPLHISKYYVKCGTESFIHAGLSPLLELRKNYVILV